MVDADVVASFCQVSFPGGGKGREGGFSFLLVQWDSEPLPPFSYS